MFAGVCLVLTFHLWASYLRQNPGDLYILDFTRTEHDACIQVLQMNTCRHGWHGKKSGKIWDTQKDTSLLIHPAPRTLGPSKEAIFEVSGFLGHCKYVYLYIFQRLTSNPKEMLPQRDFPIFRFQQVNHVEPQGWCIDIDLESVFIVVCCCSECFGPWKKMKKVERNNQNRGHLGSWFIMYKYTLVCINSWY